MRTWALSTVLFTCAVCVANPLTIATAILPNAIIGKPYSAQLTATGGVAPYSWSLMFANQLSQFGLSLTAAGLISGTASAPYGGSGLNVGVIVTDAAGTTVQGSISLAIMPPLSLPNNGLLPAGMVGRAYEGSVMAGAGSPPYTYSIISGSLPPGITLNPTSGSLTGVPLTGGTFKFTVRVADAGGASVTQEFSIDVGDGSKLTITALPVAVFHVDRYTSVPFTISGGTPPYSCGGATSVPGVFFGSSPCAIYGTPRAEGTYAASLFASDSIGSRIQATIKVAVGGTVAIASESLPSAHNGTQYSYSLTASGGAPPYSWSVTNGRLPAGLALSSSGLLSGLVNDAGGVVYRFSVSATDLAGGTVNGNKELVVLQPAVVTNSLPAGQVGAPYSARLTATGGSPPYTWSLASGSLPSGIGLASDGALSGSPTLAGQFTFAVIATDSGSRSQPQMLSITVAAPVLRPVFTYDGVRNAASFVRGVAPGALITITGSNLAPALVAASSTPFPTTLGGTVVKVNGSPIPLLAVSPGQINAQLPFTLEGSTVGLEVSADGIAGDRVSVPVGPTAPGLFQISAGELLAVNENGTLNDVDHPAPAGSTVILYATGCGLFDSDLTAGDRAASDVINPLRAKASISVGESPTSVLFAGAAPGLSSGLVQVNVRIPKLATGRYPVTLVVGGVVSNGPMINVGGTPAASADAASNGSELQ